MKMARRKSHVSALEAYTEAQAVYELWINAVIADCEFSDTDSRLLRLVLLGKPPAAFIVDNYIQTRFSHALAQKDALLESVKGTKDRGQVEQVIKQMEAIDKANNVVWTPPA